MGIIIPKFTIIMWFIKRYLEKSVKKEIFKWKIIIIYWPRQVWKTTLVKKILKDYKKSWLYLNCDEIDIRSVLQDKTSTVIKEFLWNKTFVIIDEAQRVKNIWLTLKLIHDTFPEIQLIATGSSSFELANEVNEPLTWRKREFFMYPISFLELNEKYSKIELSRVLENRVIYWMYPDILNSDGESVIKNLKSLSESYLFKDIMNFWKIKKSDFLIKLLQALSLQIWKEISYSELSRLLWIDKKTVENYINILEKAFIIFRLSSLSRNIRSELKRSKKVYFYDLWVRNAIINNFNPLNLRNDKWDLFENFLIVERLKYNSKNELNKNIYFWRTTSQKEIDYIEECNWLIHWYEFKFTWNNYKKHKEFIKNYKNSEITLINNENFLSFIT